jgi:DNA-binding transcriptional LysR family regulator
MDQLECIRLFRRVAEAKSFSAIAPEFGLTQPMVSKRIAWLETELGVTLLRRSTRGIEVTSEGQKLYRHGGHALDELDAVLSSVKNEKLQLSGVLRVTASLAFARIILSPYLSGLNQQNPDLRMHFTLSDGYVDLVEKNIDLAFRIGELPDSSLKALRVAMSRRKVYASEDYLKKFGVPKSPKDLEKHRCLFYTRISDQTAWPLTDGKGKKSAFHFEPYIQSDASELIREAVLNNLGLALLPTWMIEHQSDAKKIKSVLDEYAPVPTPIYAVTTGQRELTAKQRSAIDYFRKCFERNPLLSLRA